MRTQDTPETPIQAPEIAPMAKAIREQCLTAAETRSLEEAKHRNYLVYRGLHTRLVQAYSHYCSREDKPFIAVGIKGQYALIYAECGYPRRLPPAIREEIAALGKRKTARIGGRRVFVAETSCRLEKIPVTRVEAVATDLYQLLVDAPHWDGRLD